MKRAWAESASWPSYCERLSGGLTKIAEASKELDELNKKLAVQKIAVAEKTAACERLLGEIKNATQVATEMKDEVTMKSNAMEEQSKIIAVEKKDAEEALADALPALETARLALSDLDKADITEIRETKNFENKFSELIWNDAFRLLVSNRIACSKARCEGVSTVHTPLVDPSNAVGDNVSSPVLTGVDVRGSRTRVGVGSVTQQYTESNPISNPAHDGFTIPDQLCPLPELRANAREPLTRIDLSALTSYSHCDEICGTSNIRKRTSAHKETLFFFKQNMHMNHKSVARPVTGSINWTVTGVRNLEMIIGADHR
uniref:Dynein heavy chain coiled coil stalk domain-containing protein n=1 Tax=Timema monikensis TaxID=170555 RepID=A0A7R9E9F2_9NEOP|nr:unnamed protein product [Timema monikensis]